MKKPQDCKNIAEIRESIDDIDKQIIELIGKRYQYVKEIVKFKKNQVDVEAKPRYEEVLKIRREWAQNEGLSADVVESMYKTMIQYFIEEQMRLLQQNN
jgi:isochorismate pyruvate lyase